MRKPTLAVDFDGVIHSYTSGWRGARVILDPPVPGAMAFLLGALDDFEVAIFSSRSRRMGGRTAMRDYLRHYMTASLWQMMVRHKNVDAFKTVTELLHKSVRDGERTAPDQAAWVARQVVGKYLSFPLFKPSAHVLLDDRAIQFNGYFPSNGTLLEFRPWNKR